MVKDYLCYVIPLPTRGQAGIYAVVPTACSSCWIRRGELVLL